MLRAHAQQEEDQLLEYPQEQPQVQELRLHSTDASSCSEDEAEREAEEDPEAEEDKEGSAAGKSSPTPNGQGLSLHKKPRGRSPRGTNGLPMRWDGPKEAGRWVVDNGGAGAVALGLSAGGGSQDDPIDLCD